MRASDIVLDEIDLTLPPGSLAAFIDNARCALGEGDVAAEAARDLRELAGLMRAAGVFEVLSVRDPRLQALIEGDLAA